MLKNHFPQEVQWTISNARQNAHSQLEVNALILVQFLLNIRSTDGRNPEEFKSKGLE